MTLLAGSAELAGRRALASGPLAPLAASLAADLDRLLPDEDFFIPPEKARLTRGGGRCARDGSLLEFDPQSPRRHRCPQCGDRYDDEAHYRWWVMGYQLWLAERAVHAAVLWALLGNARHRRLATTILNRLAERYESYPNVDNVLGPARPFFSTYLESIWLLQLCVALDVLESRDASRGEFAGVRARLIEPSMELIALYDEGDSNRQVWNNAALAVAGGLVDRADLVDRALFGPSGLQRHLERGLLRDGTWYEGENYHLFAHRGLWYLVTLAERRGAGLPAPLVRRFDEGFAAPFRTALPDFTFPSRRDSPYQVSLRQWRLAESAELGLARHPGDERLASAWWELYREDAPAGDPARWRSTAEAERNVPGVRLTRADLGWKALLFARGDPPSPAPPADAESILLEGQGFAVIRRDRGAVYVALDYGHAGGGHGHPDRLNLWLVHGAARVLEDVGTGSYVDPALHWYRSTLAHNAPLLGGRSQPRVDGWLGAWDAGDGVTWIDAAVELTPAEIRRTVVVSAHYLVDTVTWTAPDEVQVDLPFHVTGEPDPSLEWRAAILPGGRGLEDGFAFVERAERGGSHPRLRLDQTGMQAWITTEAPHEWWRCVAPGPPGQPHRTFLLVRASGRQGQITTVWAWHASVRESSSEGGVTCVTMADGAVHEHRREALGWCVSERTPRGARETVLRGLRERPLPDESRPPRAPAPQREIPLLDRGPAAVGDLTRWSAEPGARVPLPFRLGRQHYRRTEPSWREAGAPEALVALGATQDHLFVEITIRKDEVLFAPARAENPLDNEHPDINSDGVQLHLEVRDGPAVRRYSWILVPDADTDRVRVTPREVEGEPLLLDASWRRVTSGFQILATIPRRVAGGSAERVALDVIVNETAPGRERRRGQLVLSGAVGEWAYLRGDRQDAANLLPFRIADA
ncbi:MAG TPA: heparinase II/III family protein [Gemmatimonadaceae bacterium]|nr:heparinase II/III family protein [Gemmatimonadaceae bacterium]